MNEIKNSALLDQILKRATSMMTNANKKSLSVNIVFAAILEFRHLVLNIDSMAQYAQMQETKNLLEIMKDIPTDAIEEKINLLCLSEEKVTDSLLFSSALAVAKTISIKKGSNYVFVDTLMECLMNHPTSEMKSIMTDKKISDYGVTIDLDGNRNNDDENTQQNSTIEGDQDSPIVSFDIFNPQGDDKVKSENEIEQQKEYIANLTAKVKDIQKKLTKDILGQDNAINIFTSGYFQAELKSLLDKNNKKPLATFLFAGPPGVGKTLLAEKAADSLGLKFKRFDMSEFSDSESVMELIGTNPSYKNDKEGELTGFVEKNPKCVLLFDEIEKANITIIHLFLQVLDAGRLRDVNTGKDVDFSKTVIIFTTNAAREIYENSPTLNLSGVSRKTILKALEDDVDPKSGKSVFPAAICSRFATGNVIMFNHMEAHVLRKIAVDEITRIVECIEEEMGIKCYVDDDVYSCLLFSEGGHVDARTIKSRAGSFINNELYELFRLISSKNSNTDIENVENIKITLELPTKGAERKLFRDDYKGSVLSFGDTGICNKLNEIVASMGYKNIVCSSLEEAKNYVNRYDVEFVLCDFQTGKKVDVFRELNIEDVDSDGRTFFRYICEHTDIPLYVISDETHRYSEEEEFSLIKEGARAILDVSDTQSLEGKLTEILVKLHHQQSMNDLARASKIVTYETAQTVSEDGKTAEIRLYDIALATAISAEDKKDILSDMSKPNVKLKDVYGADEVKDELEYFINYLKDPKAFSSKGLGVPKGVLFYGPPGTGKTMLAKAVAGETDVTFISAEGNQFIKEIYGQGEAAVRTLFAKARKYAPSIIFIDEIDAIAKERTGGNDSQPERILNALLGQMDGFTTDPKKPVFVLAATNFEIAPGTSKSLDAALLRRFDRCVYIGLPSKETRKKYLTDKIVEKPVFDISSSEIDNIAVRSAGMSLAQLSSVFEFAMRIAVMKNYNKITDDVFEEAFETFTHGEEKHWDQSELTKTAFHEAGHAFLCWYNGETPSYLTIVARGNVGGYMRHGDSENVGCYTKTMLLNRIECSMAGRAAELVFFGENEGLSTGASGDLRNATYLAKRMICDYGMDESIGLAVINENELSDGVMAQKVREATNNILANALAKAKEILAENRIAVEEIVEALLEKNHMGASEIDAIFSKYAKQKNN